MTCSRPSVAIVASFFIRFEETGLAERFDGPASGSCPASWSMRASSISCSGCTPRSGASPRCPTCSTSSAPRPCSRSRCWCSTTSWCRRRSMARSSSARSRSSLYWFLQMAFLAGSRIAYRQFRYVRTQQLARGEHAAADAACSGARPMPRCCCARSRAARSAASARSASCRRRSPTAASRCAAFRWSAASTISNRWCATARRAARISCG